jgi:exopolyphosphatase/guanosine-5'-triphosphate,3'-diphosphate pyrophosphatase
VLATSAVREASNSREFITAVEATMGCKVRILSGPEEAHFAALGVVSGMPGLACVVGDLGGGSLELSSIDNGVDAGGETHELGVIRLQDDSDGSATKAAEIARERLARSILAVSPTSKIFCAIGGTWRALAKIHQVLSNYPMHMVQHYAVEAEDLLKLCDEIVAASEVGKSYPGSNTVSSSRRELVPFGAAVLAEVIRSGQFERVIFSALGVREGYLYGLLAENEQQVDPLVQAAEDISVLRSRSPAHAHDLIGFSAGFFEALGIEESVSDRRLREVACLLSDIGWRGHPDYRGEQSVDMVAYSSVTGVDHIERAFLAQVLAVRYMGLKHKSINQKLLELAGTEGSVRARLIGALFRVAYPMSAAMPGVISRASFELDGNCLTLKLPLDLKFLDGEHLRGRLDQLCNAAGIKKSAIVAG